MAFTGRVVVLATCMLTVYLSLLFYRMTIDNKRLSVYSTHMDLIPDRQFLATNQLVIFTSC
jgi:hypothetical protein